MNGVDKRLSSVCAILLRCRGSRISRIVATHQLRSFRDQSCTRSCTYIWAHAPLSIIIHPSNMVPNPSLMRPGNRWATYKVYTVQGLDKYVLKKLPDEVRDPYRTASTCCRKLGVPEAKSVGSISVMHGSYSCVMEVSLMVWSLKYHLRRRLLLKEF